MWLYVRSLGGRKSLWERDEPPLPISYSPDDKALLRSTWWYFYRVKIIIICYAYLLYSRPIHWAHQRGIIHASKGYIHAPNAYIECIEGHPFILLFIHAGNTLGIDLKITSRYIILHNIVHLVAWKRNCMTTKLVTVVQYWSPYSCIEITIGDFGNRLGPCIYV